MQTVNAAFTAEAKDKTRKVAASLLASWKKDFRSDITFFTIGVSTIGGNDIIPGPAGVQSEWNRYLYEDESDNLISLDYERSLNVPLGGISQSLADFVLSNTSGRYLPEYMGGDSAIYTAVHKPMRPFVINTGFEISGVNDLIPQFVGVNRRVPELDTRSQQMRITAHDFIEFLSNRYLDSTAMYTDIRTDELIETFLTDLGFATAQYELDSGINTLKFALFEKGAKLIDIIDKLTKSELGHFYQDEEGKLRFENRQHWQNPPHNAVQQVIYTADVINAEAPDSDHIVNVVEVVAEPRVKQPNQLVFKLGGVIEIAAGEEHELFVDFDDPMLEVDTPLYVANTAVDGSGTDVTSSVDLVSISVFAQSAKYIFDNTTAATAYITDLTINGRPAKVQKEIYTRLQDDSSVTAYEERPILIESDYIQDETWAESLAQLILNNWSDPDGIQKIIIKARPHLQMGDLISWQGKYWRIFGVKTDLSPSVGFVQTLSLLRVRELVTYFTIGISSIGGSDVIAP